MVTTIHRLARQGVALNYASVKCVDSSLPQAARRTFGSWDGALCAAGYDPDAIRVQRRPWTDHEMIALIRNRVAAGLPIGRYSVVPRSALKASRRLSGSWPTALRAAGVSNPHAWPVWSANAVVAAIRARLDAAPDGWEKEHPDLARLLTPTSRHKN